MRNWGGDVSDERWNRGCAASYRVERRASEILVGGVARHHDMSHKVGRQANPPGQNKATYKAYLAKANLVNAKGRAEASSKVKADTKAKLKLKVKLK